MERLQDIKCVDLASALGIRVRLSGVRLFPLPEVNRPSVPVVPRMQTTHLGHPQWHRN